MLFLPVLLALLATCQCNTAFNKKARNFSMELMKHTVEETQWHSVTSPFGIWTLLYAVSIGATENSRHQLLRTLNMPKKKRSVMKNYNKFLKSVITPPSPDIQLKCNNFLFLDSGFITEGEFEQSIINDFHAKVTKLNFKSSAEAADTANSIIKKTDSSISNVFEAEDFMNAKMILTNTISFKGNWQLPFNASETRVRDFYDETGKVIGKVNMMQQQGSFQMSNLKKISASALELPYGTTNKYSFIVILPYEKVPLADVYNAMKSFDLQEFLNQMKSDTEEYGLAGVVVNLPRFKITTDVVLNKPLTSMGLVDIFDPLKARFNRITKKERLYVSSIVHKAEIEVTETGTIATADTSAIYMDRSLPFDFNAQRSFLYFIIEKSTATIIFSGSYSTPTLY